MLICPGCGEENPAKFRLCGYCGTALTPAPAPVAREVRKTVTLIFCDLKGSTALGEVLDPEAMHEVKERYFAAMSQEIRRHGGKIEKYIGDAIMAVFGLPRANEDDALRAVRAALGMRQSLRALNDQLQRAYGVSLSNRTGVNTGEVVANDDPGADQKLATGDAVNVTARLEQSAGEDEILIGEVTQRLVRHAVVSEPVPPLSVKGKSQPLPAWRLVGLRDGHDDGRRHDTPLVGRDAELALLIQQQQACVDDGRTRLVTLIGEAGVGKSRLVQALQEQLGGAVQWLSGRCLPYGDGITFWPLRMMVRDAAGIREQDSPEQALQRLHDRVGDADVTARLAGAIGLSSQPFPLGETYWAARKFLTACAAASPVVVLVDDIHWAEPAFLDLIEHLVDQDDGVPVLLVTTARQDLLEAREGWSTGQRCERVLLQPLGPQAAADVLRHLAGGLALPAAVVDRITQAAEGNPLFAEQMLSMLIDDGTLRQVQGQWVCEASHRGIQVPPSIQALLEARLDRLSSLERATVGPASVIGLEFEQPAVASLCPEPLRPALPTHLASLVQRQFLRPLHADTALITAAAAFRFHHHLVRDTVYFGLLKRARAQLHLGFVRWADGVNAQRDRAREFEEILGYHLEQAHRYLRELGPLDAEGRAVGADAAGRLSSAGRRALARGDMNAAANLYRRAVALLEDHDPQRIRLLPELGETLIGLGDFSGARQVLKEAAERAGASGDVRTECAAAVYELLVGLYSGQQQDDWSEQALTTAHRSIERLEPLEADAELATAWRLVVLVHGIAGRYSRASEAVEHAIVHARRAGNDRLVARNALVQAMNALHGPTPVAQGIAQCEQLLAQGLTDRQVECNVLCVLAQLRAMNGQASDAQTLMLRNRALLRDLGQGVYAASTAIDLARVALLGGNLAAAEQELRIDRAFLAAKGETYFLSTLDALLASLLREQGRDDEAMAMSRSAESLSAPDDLESQALWRMARAPLLARAGDGDGAHALAHAALELVRQTESPMLQADALAGLGEVLQLQGRRREAAAAFDEALALTQGKGNQVRSQQLLERRSALGAG